MSFLDNLSLVAPRLSAFDAAAVEPATGSSGSGSSTTAQPIDYMKLIVAQMQNMNPMDPSSGDNSTAEMMQAEELNLLTTLNQSITQQQQTQQASYGAALIGRSINGTGSDGEPAAGVVAGLEVQSNQVLLQLQSGVLVPVSGVFSVAQAPAAGTATTSLAAGTHGVPAG